MIGFTQRRKGTKKGRKENSSSFRLFFAPLRETLFCLLSHIDDYSTVSSDWGDEERSGV
jgi:hypothetical protein